MYKTSLILIVLSITFTCFGKKHKYESKPKNMVFCPQGSFTHHRIESGDTIHTNINIRSFWVGNEVTNREFREFYHYLKNNIDGKTEWVDFISSKESTLNQIISSLANSDILSKHINTETKVLGKENYFFNPDFDNFPVVGISKTAARMFCIWKTNQINNKLREEGKPEVMSYRLPTEVEWDYLNSFKDHKRQKDTTLDLHPVKSGIYSNLRIFNVKGNVAEITSSTRKINDKKLCVIKGTSYKKECSNVELISSNETSEHIGFRIIRDYIGN